MYGKLFKSMYDGTLADHWEALVTFQQFLILCDRDGIVDMTTRAISARTGIPREIVEKGIAILEAPDENSRTEKDEGRRIKLLNPERQWGWVVVNHEKYQRIRTKEDRREYMKQYMRVRRSKQSLTPVNNGLTELAHIDVDVDVEDKKGEGSPSPSSPKKKGVKVVPYPAAFEAFWLVARKGSKKKAHNQWKKAKKIIPSDELIKIYEKQKEAKEDLQRQGEFAAPFPDTFRWLRDRRWEDVYENMEKEEPAPPKNVTREYNPATGRVEIVNE